MLPVVVLTVAICNSNMKRYRPNECISELVGDAFKVDGRGCLNKN